MANFSDHPLSMSGVAVSTHFLLPSGYGFVDFESPNDALRAVQALQANGVLAQFAKVPQV